MAAHRNIIPGKDTAYTRRCRTERVLDRMPHEIDAIKLRRLVLDRRRACGVGLCGSCEAITRWLMQEHDILTTPTTVGLIIQEARKNAQS